MKTNPILQEIRATRDKLADEAGGDMRRLFAMVRERSKALRPQGEVTIPEPMRDDAGCKVLSGVDLQNRKDPTS